MKYRGLLATCLLLATISIAGHVSTARATSKTDAECRKRLKTIYEALKQDVEINDAMPATLFELLDLGLIDDPAVLFDPRGNEIGQHGQARLCTPFKVVATDLAGDLVVSDEPYEGRIFVLRADGSVVVRAVNVAEYYGETQAPKQDKSTNPRDLEVPSAGLGVVVDDRHEQVIVRAIIPGYGTTEGRAREINDLRRGDRLINVEGRRVTTQDDLENYLRTIGPLETYGPTRPQVYLLRDGKLLRRRAMVPLIAINVQPTDKPSAVYHMARVYLSDAGPGSLGITAQKNPSGGVQVTSVASDEAQAKLRVGDVITHVEDTPVNNIDELNKQIKFYLAGMSINLRVVRDGEPTTVSFTLRSTDPGVVARGRFAIYRGRLDVDAALAISGGQLATSVMALLEETRGAQAALQWANETIARADAAQQWQMPLILENRADLAAKLGHIEAAVAGYDQAAQSWGASNAAWGARRKKVELLIETGRLDQAKRVTRAWDLAGDASARRTAIDAAYMYAAHGALSEAMSLLEKLKAFADMQQEAGAMLQSLRTTPPSPRSEVSGASNSDANKVISEMVMAARANDVERLNELLGRASMGPDVLGREAASPLLIAAARGQAQAVAMLLKAGADANQRYVGSHSHGNTPLIFAIQAGHANIVHLLIENGADLNCAGGEGQTPLMVAAAQKKTDIVRELLERGALVNKTVIERDGVAHGGYSALMVAAMNGHEEIVQILLDKGADPNLRGADGMTARQLADAGGHPDVANRLTESPR